MTAAPVYPERLRVAVPCSSALGEGVIWDWRTQTLLWVDIKGCKVWRWQPDSGCDAVASDVGAQVGFALLTDDPDILILGMQTALARYRLSDGALADLVRPEPDLPRNRLNDGCVGPDGSIYFGTMDDGETDRTGAFYRWSPSLGLTRFGYRAIVTNGPTIDAARAVLYSSDSEGSRVYRHRLAADGTPDEGELLITFPPGSGHPDGMTLDDTGDLWICHYGGSRVTRFTPDGEAVLQVPVPTSQVTKMAFGGPDLATLYVTTAAHGHDRDTELLAGHIFATEPGFRGLKALLAPVPPVPASTV